MGSHPINLGFRFLLELAALIALAAWALAASGHANLGIALSVAVAIHYAISYDRIAWLVAR